MNIHEPNVATTFPIKSTYNYDELLAFANREFGDDLPPLPLPPWLMLHRILDIQKHGGEFKMGYAIAEYDVTPDGRFSRATSRTTH